MAVEQILGAGTLEQIRDRLATASDPILTIWEAQKRIAAYIGEMTDYTDSQARAPNGAFIAPYSVFIVVTRISGIITSYEVAFPQDDSSDYTSVLPTRWGPLLTSTTFSATDLDILIRTSNILAAYYKIPRGNEADITAVPKSEGLLYYAKDTRILYLCLRNNVGALAWMPLMIPESFPVAGMIRWSDAITLPLTMFKWLKCDGSTVSQTTYADLYAIIGTTFGPDTGGMFTLPTESNTIIRSLV